MKLSLLKVSICFAILLFSVSLHAQDYVVTVKGDTIPCKIRFPAISGFSSIPNHAKYKAKGMKDYQPIVAGEIKEYIFADEFIPNEFVHFRTVYILKADTVQYLQVLEKGKINLYQKQSVSYGPLSNFRAKTSNNLPSGGAGGSNGFGSASAGGSGPIDWYVSKGSDTVSQIKTNGLAADETRKDRKDELGELLKDNETLYNQYISDDKFSFKQIRNLIHLYNTGKPYKDKLVDW